ncbi:MAG: DNA helicase II [Gammaproteobacteria bacterium]|nr:MAG: DNA helicase II [Gammaproteobacteria bacterium]
MDVTKILDDLNEAQRQAVTAPLGQLRVIAGAGSGKTRVLVHRIAWLIAVEHASPHGILAVTFTNKAASEIRSRLEAMLGYALSGFWVGTFHSICHRILRTHHDRVGLIRDFQILDRDDQLRLVKRIIRAHDLDEKMVTPRQIVAAISNYKEEGKRFTDIDKNVFHPVDKQILFVYQHYEQHCRDNSLVDFTELLLRAVELLRDDALIRRHYQQRFDHILVDEFQDTNAIQYALIQLLQTDNSDMLVVGDDDQSIYGFRGARIEHILDLEKKLPRLVTVKLEQNYRSTGNILSAANAVIAQNSERLGKNLWTEAGQGEKVEVYQSINEYDEAYYVSERIKSHIESGGTYLDIAILYRSNAQSRLFEEALLAEAIPYRIYGGLRFFDRAEVKDAVAYLRLVENHHDDVAFDRIVNMPTRGIGARTMDKIREVARANRCSLWQATEAVIAQRQQLPARANNALAGFVELINNLYADALPLPEYIKTVIDGSGLIDYFNNKKIERKEDKIENLEELTNAAEQFISRLDEADKADAVSLFLVQAALDAGETQASEFSDYVQLMTLHSAKGLEFPQVFIVGMEEGLFPHKESAMIAEQLAEERRLAYVGITRAKKKLHLSYAEKRRLYGETTYPRPSRFIEEIPEDILDYARGGPDQLRRQISQGRQQTLREQTEGGVSLGQHIVHPKFGEGTITAVEGEGERQRIQVNFAKHGNKWLILAFAKIELR